MTETHEQAVPQEQEQTASQSAPEQKKPDELDQTIAHIASVLNESDKQPLTHIRRIVGRFGAEFALKVLDDALKIEQEGGLMISDGSRRRTPGGVFFYLVRGRIERKDIYEIFYKDQANKPKHKQQRQLAVFQWGERLEIARELVQAYGEGKVKITLIGRPGKVVEKQQFIITMIRDTKMPALPRGLPQPPTDPTNFMVYISKKQWNRVRDDIKNPDDKLIIEGVARYDPELEGMAVFATSTISKLAQQRQRQAQKQQQQEGASDDA